MKIYPKVCQAGWVLRRHEDGEVYGEAEWQTETGALIHRITIQRPISHDPRKDSLYDYRNSKTYEKIIFVKRYENITSNSNPDWIKMEE